MSYNNGLLQLLRTLQANNVLTVKDGLSSGRQSTVVFNVNGTYKSMCLETISTELVNRLYDLFGYTGPFQAIVGHNENAMIIGAIGATNGRGLECHTILGEVMTPPNDTSKKKFVIIDAVMASGKHFRDMHNIVTKSGGIVVGAVVFCDRQQPSEKNPEISVLAELREELNIPILRVTNLEQISEVIDKIGLPSEKVELFHNYVREHCVPEKF